jgi:hypothetical protein
MARIELVKAVLAHAGTDNVLSAHKIAVVSIVCAGSTQQAALHSSFFVEAVPFHACE